MVMQVPINFVAPPGMTFTEATSIRRLARARTVPVKQQKDIVRVNVPAFWVYAVVRLK